MLFTMQLWSCRLDSTVADSTAINSTVVHSAALPPRQGHLGIGEDFRSGWETTTKQNLCKKWNINQLPNPNQIPSLRCRWSDAASAISSAEIVAAGVLLLVSRPSVDHR